MDVFRHHCEISNFITYPTLVASIALSVCLKFKCIFFAETLWSLVSQLY